MEKFVSLLGEKYLEAKSRSGQFSQRAFAKKMGLSSGALSEILNGKRKLSPKVAERIADRLNLNSRDRKQLGLQPQRKNNHPFHLDRDSFHLIADWWHYALLNLIETKGFQSNPKWIAKRLGVTETKIRESIALLERLNLIKNSPKQGLSRTHLYLETSDNVLDLAIQKSHRENFSLAAEAMDRVAVDLRDLTSLTLRVDPAKMSQLKTMIRSFQDEFMELAEADPSSEVYRLSIQFFPLTKVPSSGDHV